MYAELRPMLLDKFIPTNDGKGKITNKEQMQLVIDGYTAKQEELKARGELDKFPFGLKIVYCTPRSIPKKMMQEEMKQCIELKEKFPHLICGKFQYQSKSNQPPNISQDSTLSVPKTDPTISAFTKRSLLRSKQHAKLRTLIYRFCFTRASPYWTRGDLVTQANPICTIPSLLEPNASAMVLLS